MRQSKFFMLLISLFLIFAFYSCDDILNNDDTDPDPDPVAETIGDTLWIHSIENQDKYFINSSLAIGQNGYLYYAVSGGTVWWSAAKIIALNQEGQIMWESEDTDAIGIHSEIMIGDDGTVYVLGAYRLYAFDPSNGATKWIWEVPTTVPNPDNPQSDIYTYGELGSLALTDNGHIMTQTGGSGSYARAIYCINPDGNTVYYNLGASGWGAETGLYIGKNNTCYYYSRDINFEVPGLSLVALDVLSGSVKWTTEILSGNCSANNIAIQDDGNLFCAFTPLNSTEVKYHLVNGASGAILWTGSETTQCHYKMIGPDNTWYRDWGAFKVNPGTGAETELALSGARLSAITSDNKLVTAYTDADWIRKLGVFTPDGLIDPDLNVHMAGLEGTDLVIGENKVIYGIINEHSASRIPTKICAIQADFTLANSGWPRPHHDNRNTSNINKF